MTNEEWLVKWMKTETGISFIKEHADYWNKLKEHLKAGLLLEVDPAEGVAGPCVCGKSGLGKDIRFLLDDYEFMSVCPGCESWQIFRTRKGEKKFGRL